MEKRTHFPADNMCACGKINTRTLIEVGEISLKLRRTQR